MTSSRIDHLLNRLDKDLRRSVATFAPGIAREESGHVLATVPGIVWADGLDRVRSEELVEFHGNVGMALDILPDRVGIVLLDKGEAIAAGDEVVRTGSVLSVPVGECLLGRVLDPLGRPLDNKGAIEAVDHLPVEREAPAISDRAPVARPLMTGLKIIDALFPIGRGQRELVLGDRQTGKTTLCLETICNQTDVVSIYCAIGQKSSSVAWVAAELAQRGAMGNTILVVAESSDPPGLQYIAPYAATTMGEYFMAQGKDVLLVFDDLTRHSQAYRQISLLLRRPPGREAFPGDIFYIHARLLERAASLAGKTGGSLTALPVIETEAGNMAAYIPTNLISITDGQICLSSELFHRGILPAVNVGLSVSRVGGKAQLPCYRNVAADLKLSYSQFQELEIFARFGTRLDAATRHSLEHGRRIRAILQQRRGILLSPAVQAGLLFAATRGLLDRVPFEKMSQAEKLIIDCVTQDRGLARDLPAAGTDAPLWQELAARLTEALSPLVPAEKLPHDDR